MSVESPAFALDAVTASAAPDAVSQAPALTALVLAAGEGRRFDPSGRRWKLAEALPDGRAI
ncbi:MAG TPA: hypothetical protein PK177_20220 [Burkholderiaceae bacterium]|nr:hypothetical protein [Burkholderiaceae bacterium]